MDASFIYMETASGPAHISALYVIDGELPFERVFRHFQARMHLVPRYMRRLMFVPFNLAHPKWVDDPDFDLANHLVRHQLPAGSSLRDAVDAAMELNEPMLDRSRPLWKCYVIEGVPGKTVLLQMTHHAMIDGVSGVELSMVLFDFDPDATDPPPPEEPWHPAPLPSAVDLVREALEEGFARLRRRNARPVRRFDRAGLSSLSDAARQFARFVRKPVITAPFNAGMVGPKRSFGWITHSFGEVREVRRELGGTINDVVLTVVTEAIARYLEGRGVAVAGQYQRIMCPVSVRTEDEKDAVGNRVSAIFPVLPAWPMAVTERLQHIVTETQRIKASGEAQTLARLSEGAEDLPPVGMMMAQLIGTPFDPTALAARFPAPVFPELAARLPNFGVNYTCTNVPGVQVPMYLAGHEITDNLGVLMLTGNLGFGVAILSYNKQLAYAFICEPRLMPDLEQVTAAAEAVFGELLSAARERHDCAADEPAVPSTTGPTTGSTTGSTTEFTIESEAS